jgi:hypothetical protein
MSLIQEALKRQQAETEGTQPPETTTAIPVSTEPIAAPELPSIKAAPTAATPPSAASIPAATPVPPPISEPTRETPPPTVDKVEAPVTVESDSKSSNGIPGVIGVILLIILLVGAVTWAIMYGLNAASMKSKSTTIATVESPVTGEALTVTEPIDVQPKAETPTVVENSVEPAITEHDPSPREPEVSAATEQPAQTESVPTVTEAPEALPPTTPTVVTPPTPKAQWPALKLSGIVGGGHGGAAIINGKILGVNETVEGVRVLRIEQKGAVLEYKNEKRFLKVGKSIE